MCPALWLRKLHMIFYYRVEIHNARRVLCQFGRYQPIPHDPPARAEDEHLHSVSRRGGGQTNDWRAIHVTYLDACNRRGAKPT